MCDNSSKLSDAPPHVFRNKRLSRFFKRSSLGGHSAMQSSELPFSVWQPWALEPQVSSNSSAMHCLHVPLFLIGCPPFIAFGLLLGFPVLMWGLLYWLTGRAMPTMRRRNARLTNEAMRTRSSFIEQGFVISSLPLRRVGNLLNH